MSNFDETDAATQVSNLFDSLELNNFTATLAVSFIIAELASTYPDGPDAFLELFISLARSAISELDKTTVN